jgi:hypothetical protein
MNRWVTQTVQVISPHSFFSDFLPPSLGAGTFYLTVTIIQPGPDNFLGNIEGKYDSKLETG